MLAVSQFRPFFKAAAFLMLGGIGPIQSLSGATITLRFTAVIDSLHVSRPFDSGLHLTPGDHVIGEFAFVPTEGDGGQHAVQSGLSARLIVDGHVLTTPMSANDVNLESFNDDVVYDVPFADMVDTIQAGGTVVPKSPGELPNISALSNFKVTLWGQTSTLESACFPANGEIWNSFDIWRNLTVGIRGNDGGAIGFDASIVNISIVPEPALHAFLAGFLLIPLRAMLRLRTMRS